MTEILTVVAGQKAKQMYESGDLDLGVISCGQGVGLCHDMPTVQELLDRMVEEAERVLERLNRHPGEGRGPEVLGFPGFRPPPE